MIPKEAIEKAIERGWELRDYDGFVMQLQDLDLKRSWQGIALDPSFWQALGKALGWRQKLYKQSVPARVSAFRKDGTRSSVPALVRMMRRPTPNRWKKEANRFYDLILTGGDTDKFWQELLDQSKPL